ncbi:MAG: hypothetical protein JJE04_03850 [Acidobacteriia bacterium]|nr:hypothetical protein [Terriglobia bacterium]
MDIHLSEELLEQYSLGHISEQEELLVEEHILLCDLCQRKLQEADEFVQAFRIAAPRVTAGTERAGEPARHAILRPFVNLWTSMGSYLRPVPVAGLVAAAAVAVVLIVPRNPVVTQLRVMELRAIRSDASSVARTSDSLTLRLNVEGLPEQKIYLVEIVGAGGDLVWSSPAETSGGMLTVSPGPLRNVGAYWVRVLRSDGSRSLVREFALEIRPGD